MAKFTLVAVKGTDINVNIEAEMTLAEIAQVLTTSRDAMKDLIGLLHDAKATAKEVYEEFKPMFQRKAAAALDRDTSNWSREEEEKSLRHEIEMEKLRQELAELRAKAAEKIHDAEVERIKEETLARAERCSRNTVTGTDAKPTETSEEGVNIVRINNGECYRRVNTIAGNETSSHRNQMEDTSTETVVARIPNGGDFSRRVDVAAGNTSANGVRVVRINNDENLARRIAETTATTRDRD